MLKKRLILRVVSSSLILMMLLVVVGCGTPAVSTTGQQASVPAGQPVKGGTLKMINIYGPQVLGYNPMMGPTDDSGVFPAVERIMDYTTDRTFKPFLAKSVVEDQDKLTVTISLNQGIKFSDGTELTADVAQWNYQLLKDNKKLQYGDKVKSIEVKDKYTLILHLSEWNNLMIIGVGWVPMYSKEAFEKNGGKEWALTHVVSTGPYKLETFNRDVSISWVRNEDYWQKDKGMPYLDRIEVKFIPDATTARAMMEAGEADIWINAPAKDKADLKNKGFVVQGGWAGSQYSLMPNTETPNSKWNDIRLRQAVEYAVDRPAIAKAIGYGLYEPLTQVTPSGEWGSDPNYANRNYDPAKAKQLLAEAGYPNGLKITMVAQAATGGRNIEAEAIKGYLDAVGIQTNIDIADPGRYSAAKAKNGWEDLLLGFSTNQSNYLVSGSNWWGPNPRTKLVSVKCTPQLASLFNNALKVRTEAEQKAATEKIVKEITDEVMVIPVYHYPASIIIKPYVHTTYPKTSLSKWDFSTTWMDKK